VRHFGLSISFSILGILLTTSAAANPLPAPRGWQETQLHGSRVLTKGSSRLEIGPWQSLEGQSLEVYLASIAGNVPDHVTFVSSAAVKPEGKNGAFTITRKIRLSGKAGLSILYGCPGQPGFARIMEMSVANTSLGEAVSGGLFADRVCNEESKGGGREELDALSSIDQTHTGKSSVTSATIKSNDDFDANVGEIPGLLSVWHTGDSGALGVSWRTYMAFNDGKLTHDVVTFMEEGRSHSESVNPDRWRSYSVEGDELIITTPSGGTSKPFFSTRTFPGGADQRYDGCWTADTNFIPSPSVFVNAIFSSRTYCFSPNGKYIAGSEATYTIRGNTKKNASEGTYQIEGHMLTLKATTGEVSRAVFGWYHTSTSSFPTLVIGRNGFTRK